MSVRIRLRRMGAKKQPFYRVVVADSRSPRDGRFLDTIGTYDPRKEPVAIDIDREIETLRRDLWSIVTRFQEPGGFVEGVQLYLEADRVSVVSDHFRRPMRLTAPELCALELGLAAARRAVRVFASSATKSYPPKKRTVFACVWPVT